MSVLAASAGNSANALTIIYIVVTVVLAIAVPLGGYLFKSSAQSLRENTQATSALAGQVARMDEKVHEHERQLREQARQVREHDQALERLSGRLGYGR